jgi:hypothetical protein
MTGHIQRYVRKHSDHLYRTRATLTNDRGSGRIKPKELQSKRNQAEKFT